MTRGPGRHQRLGRHPYRAPGFDPDDHVRRARSQRGVRDREAFQELDYRAVFGTMTQWTAEIDDADARARARVARLLCGDQRPAWAGGDQPAARHADRAGFGRCRDAPSEPVETSPGADEMAKLAELLQPGASGPSSSWAAAAGTKRPARAHARASRSASTCRSAPATAAAPLFDALHPNYAGDVGLAPNPKLIARVKAADLVVMFGGRLERDRHRRATPCSTSPSPASTLVHVYPGVEELGRVYRADLAIHATPTRFAAGARQAVGRRPGPMAPKTPPPPMPTTSPGAKSRPPQPGGVNLGAVMVWLRQNLPAGRDPVQRRRQLRGLDPSLLPLPALRLPYRADLGVDGLRHPGRGRHAAPPSRTAS